jgi:hypothetical protein
VCTPIRAVIGTGLLRVSNRRSGRKYSLFFCGTTFESELTVLSVRFLGSEMKCCDVCAIPTTVLSACNTVLCHFVNNCNIPVEAPPFIRGSRRTQDQVE